MSEAVGRLGGWAIRRISAWNRARLAGLPGHCRDAASTVCRMFGIKTFARKSILDLRGIADLRAIRHQWSWFPSDAEIANAANALRPAYSDYISTISTSGMAASLQTSSVLLAVARSRGVSSSLDLGSGFSSYVLRLVPGRVVSLDDNEDWLEETRTFLTDHGQDDGGVGTWKDYIPQGDCDLVFHDLANGDTRNAAMPTAVASLKPGGVIVFDDMHWVPHRQAALAASSAAGMRLFSLRSLTIDDISRYSGVGQKPSQTPAVPV